MSKYTAQELGSYVRTGFLEESIRAWHMAGIPAEELIASGRAFNGPVPRDVAESLLLWEPVTFEPVTLIAPDGNAYRLPDRLSKVVANPVSGNVVNIAGSGFNQNLHLVFAEVIEAATDAEIDIASVVMLGDGAHMGMSFRVRDSITLGGNFGGAVPYIGFNSSLTGAIATQVDTGTILRVCDNTMSAAAATAQNALKVKRTRNSSGRITASGLREALDIAFAETSTLCDELERLAQIEVNRDRLMAVLDIWCPVPDEIGRARTMRENKRAEFCRLFDGDKRNPFGSTVAGLVQTHNTWQHWAQGADDANRLERKAARTITGQVADADAEFARIIAEEFDLVAVPA